MGVCIFLHALIGLLSLLVVVNVVFGLFAALAIVRRRVRALRQGVFVLECQWHFERLQQRLDASRGTKQLVLVYIFVLCIVWVVL